MKKIVPIILCIGAMSFVEGAGYFDSTKPAADPRTSTTEFRGSTAVSNLSASDEEIAEEIKDVLSSGLFSKGYEGVKMDVSNGMVTLRGDVDTQADKDKIEKEVRDIDGVKSLNSQITVRDAMNREGNRSSAFSKDPNRQANYSQEQSRTTFSDPNRPAATPQEGTNIQSSETNKFSQDKFMTSSDEQLNKKIRDEVSEGLMWDSYEEVILITNNGVVTVAGFVEDEDDVDDLVDAIRDVEGVKDVQSNLRVKQ